MRLMVVEKPYIHTIVYRGCTRTPFSLSLHLQRHAHPQPHHITITLAITLKIAHTHICAYDHTVYSHPHIYLRLILQLRHRLRSMSTHVPHVCLSLMVCARTALEFRRVGRRLREQASEGIAKQWKSCFNARPMPIPWTR